MARCWLFVPDVCQANELSALAYIAGTNTTYVHSHLSHDFLVLTKDGVLGAP